MSKTEAAKARQAGARARGLLPRHRAGAPPGAHGEDEDAALAVPRHGRGPRAGARGGPRAAGRAARGQRILAKTPL